MRFAVLLAKSRRISKKRTRERKKNNSTGEILPGEIHALTGENKRRKLWRTLKQV